MVMARQWRQRFLRPRGARAALVVLASLACGCKTGSWGAKPSWLSLGGTAPAGSALTAAPSFDKAPTKPSEAAKPYPTTTTPEAYALDETSTLAPSLPAASGSVEPTAVTYGTTVAARTEQPAGSSSGTGFPGTAPAQNPSVAPQVGPYASLQQPANTPRATPTDPAAAAMAGFGAAPAFEAETPPPSRAGLATMPPEGTRVADASGSSAWSAGSGTPSAGLTGGQDPRYGQNPGSRFSSSTSFQPAAQPEQEPAFRPLAAPAAMVPGMNELPAADPSALPASPPSALPGAVSPPTRRRDPGYRPAGTSSYRPNRAILAEDQPPASSIQPVAYELPPSAR
jgi:hypothetical protein